MYGESPAGTGSVLAAVAADDGQAPANAAPSLAQRRWAVARRLADLFFVAAGQITSHQRALVERLLGALVVELSADERRRLADRLSRLTDPPHRLAAQLVHDSAEVASAFLEREDVFDQATLLDMIARLEVLYHVAIAKRARLDAAVIAALVAGGEPAVISTLLGNTAITLSDAVFRDLAKFAEREPGILAPLLGRADFPAELALTMFWWLPSPWRHYVLHRFGIDRQFITQALRDMVQGGVDSLGVGRAGQASEGAEQASGDNSPALAWVMGVAGLTTDSATGASAQASRLFIQWLCDPLDCAAGNALARALTVRPETILRIAADKGGECYSILAKASGLSGSDFAQLRALLVERLSSDDPDEFTRLTSLFETLSIDGAQLLIHLWDRP